MSRVVLVFGLILAVAVCGVGALYLLQADARASLRLEIAKALLQLAAIGTIGIVAKYMLDQHAERRKKLETKQRCRVDALAALTSAYWGIKKALLIIRANRSARSYTDQMQLIIDHRLALQQLWNEIESGMGPLPVRVCSHLSVMDEVLNRLVLEWKDQNLSLSRQQAEDEKNPSDRKVPSMIEALPELQQATEDKYKALHEPFMHAAGEIRLEIQKATAS